MAGDFQRDAAEWAVHNLTAAIQSPLELPCPAVLCLRLGQKLLLPLPARLLLADVSKENEMIPNSPTTPLRTMYCPHCHLATRANSERCLHCGKHVPRQSQTCGVPPTPAPRRGPSQHGRLKRAFASPAF
jgi:hypothetical protein